MKTIATLCTMLLLFTACGGEKNAKQKTQKETFFPVEGWRVEKENDYQNEDSQFNIYRMIETDNLVGFWEAGFGDDPETCEDEKFRFPLRDIMNEGDKMYVFFRDELKFVEEGKSLSDKYRMIAYFFYNEDGTVYGGGTDDTVGAMWISPNRVKKPPYGAIAHEMGHSFQYTMSADGYWAFGFNKPKSNGIAIIEMTSQYMLWQYYPEWIIFENYHLNTFMENTHKAYLHEDNCYSAPFVLEYWAGKHGKDIVARLWRDSREGEDPVMVYKRMFGLNQETFNDEIFDAYRKFVTWDMDRIREVSAPYANQHYTSLNATTDGWYRIAPEKCPQNYGYNAIPLEVPTETKEVTLQFKGLPEAEGFRSINPDKAGWRYGFLAVKEDGERVYGPVWSEKESTVTFQVPENTSHLWLVVSGAPTEHWEHIADRNPDNDEQWPYQIQLTGTKPDGSSIK